MSAETQLIPWDEFKHQLAVTQSLDIVKDILDKTAALQVYARDSRQGLDTQNKIAEYRLWTQRRAGELLAPQRENSLANLRQNAPTSQPTSSALPPKLAEIGISADESSQWQRIAAIPEAVLQEHVADTKAAKRELTTVGALRLAKELVRQTTREDNAAMVLATEPPPLQASYQTIVLDPPWDWGDEGDNDQLGRATPTYATMPLDKVAALPVGALAAVNCHLYLWITNRSLPKGFGLIEAWGFRYITCLTWIKPSFGMGNYFRGSTEQVLFAVKGSLPLLRHDAPTHFQAPRPGRHSGKPVEFYRLVESCSPGPWLEMFARQERPGWVVWGAEV